MLDCQGESAIYLFNGASFKPEVSEKCVQVEFLPDHVYCLLPSIGSTIGFVTMYSTMPEFIKDLDFHLFLGTVNYKSLK